MSERLEGARKIVKYYMWWAMGGGLIPISIVDMAAVIGIQLKMVSKLAKHYNIPFSNDVGKAIISSLLSTLSASTISKGVLISSIKGIPILGTLTAPFIMPAVSAAVTYSIGIVFIQHFESGGTLLDFDPEKAREFFKSQFEQRFNKQ